MATARLSDSQKQELVRRFRQGESTQALADQVGCSTTTITRLVRAELGEREYAALREQRQKKGGRDRQIPLAIEEEVPPPSSVALEPVTEPVTAARSQATPHPSDTAHQPSPDAADPAPPLTPNPEGVASDLASPTEATDVSERAERPEAFPDEPDGDEDPLEPAAGGTTVLAIDDADDFTDDGGVEDDLSAEDDGDEDTAQDMGDFHPVAVLPITVDDQRETVPAPWSPEVLPACAYLLVDKTVELQACPLGDIPDLGRLPSEEQQRQALVLFTNPRQAKRHCGRTQRVIKLPDPALLGRTAPYLQAQGISRVVIEGALYALPDGP